MESWPNNRLSLDSIAEESHITIVLFQISIYKDLPLRNNHLIQYLPNASCFPGALINGLNHQHSLLPQLPHCFAAILETAGALHVSDGIALDAVVRGFLLQDVDELEIVWV